MGGRKPAGVTAEGLGVSFLLRNILKLTVVMAAQVYEYTKNH